MKKTILAVMLAILVVALPRLRAQDKEKSANAANSAETEKIITPLRVQVIFTEFDGEKKISSLPYMFLVNADEKGERASVRMGLKVPIETSSNTGVKQTVFQDVGTNLDGRAEKSEDGRFLLMLNLERSSAYLPGASEKPASVGGNEVSRNQPTFQQFRTQVNLLIRDGQTIQSTVATDPVTGHVIKVDVTLNVLK